MPGVHTEDGTREIDGGAAGGGGVGRGRRIQGDRIQGGEGCSRLQEDKGVWRGERKKGKNPVDEEERVRRKLGGRGTYRRWDKAD